MLILTFKLCKEFYLKDAGYGSNFITLTIFDNRPTLSFVHRYFFSIFKLSSEILKLSIAPPLKQTNSKKWMVREEVKSTYDYILKSLLIHLVTK